MKFGEHLLLRNVVSPNALTEALEVQRFNVIRIGRILRDLGYLCQIALNRELQEFFKTKPLPESHELIEAMKCERGYAHRSKEFFERWAEKRNVTFYKSDADSATFLSASYLDEVLEAGEKEFSTNIVLHVLDDSTLHFIRASVNLDIQHKSSRLEISSQLSDDQKLKTTDPYTSLFRDVVQSAKNLGASDIHIQPTKDGVDIRLRIDGDMLTSKTLSLEHRKPFINEVKRLANFSIGVSGKAQDSRVSLNSLNIDLRASLLPSQYGEKIVLRILDLSRKFELSTLGFDEETTNDLLEALRAKNGLIVVSGPTGSGKTTTLYTLLCALDRKGKNILTLEDPVEYGIEGLTQIQVSKKLTFAEALRSVLRQDPDVILVGEIRDPETADLCLKAASTGHLVLSTLHANGAAEVISRLVSLGADPFLLKSVLRFTSAQRLVKRVCPVCSILLFGDEGVRLIEDAMGKGALNKCSHFDLRERNLKGCSLCKAGITGRVPVFEYMQKNQISKFLDTKDQSTPELKVSLKEATLRRAVKGEVDYHDILEIE